ncbi:MAG: hypothetical protein JNK87_25210, partial [Bryobacterales bacterium]|nr:hypothetical protein [Bryobacterales bacterium]
MTKLKVWLRRMAMVSLLLAIGIGIALFFVLRSNWLREEVRARIVTEAEKATGGKVSIGRFHFDPNALRFEVHDFVLRGKEPANEDPMVAISHIVVGVTVESLAARRAYLRSLKVENPRIRIITYPDGTTNIPGPKIRREGKSVFERFIDLAIREVIVEHGTFAYDHRKWPLELRARDLLVQFAWQREGPRYVGKVAARPFHFNWPKIAPLDFDVDVDLAMEKEGLRFDRVVATRGKSEIQASGRMYDYRSPRFAMDVSGNFAMAEWVKETKLPLSPEGTASAKAVFTYANSIYDLKGTVNGRRLAVRQGAWTVAPIDADTQFHLVPDLVTFTSLNARALGGTYRGSGEIRNWNRYHVNGTLNDASLEQLWNVEKGHREMAWSAAVTGPVEVQGTFTGAADTNVKAAVSLTPAGGKLPMEGLVRVEYDRGRNA